MFPILSIDGGGVRGIIHAMILAELERRTGKRIHELFGLIAGTSTGGVLALGYARPGAEGGPEYTAADLVDLYGNEGHRIFHRSVWHRMRAVGNLAEEKYSSEGIELRLVYDSTLYIEVGPQMVAWRGPAVGDPRRQVWVARG